MKTLKYLRIPIASIIVLLVTFFLNSCDDDDETAKKITVTQVFLHSAASTTTVVEKAQIGTLIRIEGSGFSTLRAVYCNGVQASVNPTFVTETSILFSLPSKDILTGAKADENVRNIIRLVSKYDDYSYSFLIAGMAPVATKDEYDIAKNKVLTISPEKGVLLNDTDVEKDVLTAVLASTTTNGSLTLNADGSFEYTPTPGFVGTDNFTYYANDGMSNSAATTATIVVTNGPLITAVSHTLAKVGETIVIYGTNFKGVTAVKFPGVATPLNSSQFTISADFTSITCVVPAGVTKGAILVDDASYTYDYMFRDECRIVNWNFGTGYGGSFGDLTALSGTSLAVVPTGGNPAAPTVVGWRSCPNTAPPSTTTCPAGMGRVGGFNFNVATVSNALIANTAGLITAATKCKDLALQMDFYISAPWGSGYFKVNFKPGTDSYTATIPPQWATLNNGQNIAMTGWQTATLPLANVASLEPLTVQDLINTLNSNGEFLFTNTDLTYNGKTYTAKAIANFQVFMGNFRIVPYTKPQ